MGTRKVLFVPLEDSDGPMRYVDMPTEEERERLKAQHLLAHDARKSRPSLDAPNPVIRQYAAEHFYGYGRWSAPYYFIGPEPGKGKGEADNLDARCRSWLDLSADEAQGDGLIGCSEHHKAFNYTKFFQLSAAGKRPPTQGTWRQLIRLLLHFNQVPVTLDSIAEYQMTEWGARAGETCVAELAALATNSLSTGQEYREIYRAGRAQYLRSRIVINRPSFVVMYGGGNALLPWWHLIATGSKYDDHFEAREIDGFSAKFFSADGIAFVVARHPVNPGGKAPPDSYWTGVADEIRKLTVQS